MANKALIGFCVLQSIALILLSMKVLITETQIQSTQKLVSTSLATRALEEVAIKSNLPTNTDKLMISKEGFRLLIREELDNYLLPGTGLVAGAKRGEKVRDLAKDEQQKIMVSDKLDEIIARGSISRIEMRLLESQIVDLAENDRKAMFTKLARGINSGDINMTKPFD